VNCALCGAPVGVFNNADGVAKRRHYRTVGSSGRFRCDDANACRNRRAAESA